MVCGDYFSQSSVDGNQYNMYYVVLFSYSALSQRRALSAEEVHEAPELQKRNSEERGRWRSCEEKEE